jgi:hypothetical protein
MAKKRLTIEIDEKDEKIINTFKSHCCLMGKSIKEVLMSLIKGFIKKR